MACCAQLKSGPRRGQPCGKRGIVQEGEDWFCGRHAPNVDGHENIPLPRQPPPRPQMARNVLCEFKPNGIPLADVDLFDLLVEPCEESEKRLKLLKGYINIRIGEPVLLNDNTLPFVFMSHLSGEEHFNRKLIAKKLSKNVEYVLSRQDVYNVGEYTLPELKLHTITFDAMRNIFVAHIQVI